MPGSAEEASEAGAGEEEVEEAVVEAEELLEASADLAKMTGEVEVMPTP